MLHFRKIPDADKCGFVNRQGITKIQCVPNVSPRSYRKYYFELNIKISDSSNFDYYVNNKLCEQI